MAKPLRENPGLAISSTVHAGLIAAVLIGFSQPVKFHDALESIPVEIVDGRELNQVPKGERTAAQVKPQPKAEKLAEIAEPKILPALNEAKKDTPAPPVPLKRQPDPGSETAKAEVKPPPQKTAATAPPRPAPENAQRPSKAEPVKTPVPPAAKPTPDERAEAPEPKPVPKPKTLPKIPPKRESDTEAKEVAPRKAAPAFKPDQLAKLLDQEHKEAEKTPVEKPMPKPKSGDDSEARSQKFDPGDISRFLSKEKPQRKASAGAELQQVASLGAPTAAAAKMSPLLWGELDAVLLEQYKRCWTFIGPGGQQKYFPEIRVLFAQDGSLASPPELLNPPSDPNLRALAESALRAVRRCDPLRIPARYQPYYEQWKGRIVRFNPEEML